MLLQHLLLHYEIFQFLKTLKKSSHFEDIVWTLILFIALGAALTTRKWVIKDGRITHSEITLYRDSCKWDYINTYAANWYINHENLIFGSRCLLRSKLHRILCFVNVNNMLTKWLNLIILWLQKEHIHYYVFLIQHYLILSIINNKNPFVSNMCNPIVTFSSVHWIKKYNIWVFDSNIYN